MASALTGARWSAAARCARQAAFDVLGAFSEALPARVQGLYERGNDVEDAWFRREGFADNQVIRQYPVKWGKDWEAHVDGFFPSSRQFVEVKSTVDIDKLPGSPVESNGVKTTSAVLQVAGAAHFDGQGKPYVIAVSPVDYAEHEYPITLTDDITGLADETAARVVRSAETGELPDRCCKRPTEGYSRFCSYVNTCFDGWTEPDPIQLGGEVATLARELRAAEEACKEAGAGAKGATHARDALRAAIREHLPGPGDYTAGGVHIRLGSVKGRESFRLKDAIAAGLLTAADAEPFTKHGDPSERWQVSTEDEA